LVAVGLSVFAFDLRGHGRSGGARGDVRSFQEFTEDLALMEGVWINHVGSVGRRFLLGHSMGGLIALRHLLDGDHGYDGVVLSAPWLRAAQPAWLRAVGRVSGALFPGLPLPNGLGADRLTRDPEMALEWRRDPLIHRRLIGRLFREAERVQRSVMREGGRTRIPPCLFLIPGDDPVVNGSVTQEFARGFAEGDVQVEILRERRHEAFNDLGREEVFDLVSSWMCRWKK
jgi:alpha-beta hydrolase superfamily lysophospholipase